MLSNGDNRHGECSNSTARLRLLETGLIRRAGSTSNSRGPVWSSHYNADNALHFRRSFVRGHR